MKCEICGNEDMTSKQDITMITVPFCTESRQIITFYNECNSCGSKIRSAMSSDEIEKNRIEMEEKSINFILRDLLREYSFISIERALELPIGTLNNWLNKIEKPTASELTMLRLIAYDKNLIKIADNQYK